jgi:ketosteroid isomerase-like protein
VRRTILIVLLTWSIMASGVWAQQALPAIAEPSITLPTDLARVLRDYEAAWTARDAAALAKLFAEDGWVLPHGREPIRGRPAIEAFYTGQGGPLALRALAYAAEGSVGYILGGYATAVGAPDAGKFTLTLRKGADGGWWIVSDMDSPNRRRQEAAAGSR